MTKKTKTSPKKAAEEAQKAVEQKEKIQRELLDSRVISSKFGNIVTVLMQSKQHEHMVLSDLQKHAVPPLLKNQYRLAEAGKEGTGHRVPVGLLTWARVSDDVHNRLSENPDKAIVLEPDEWDSGENYWIVDAIGNDRFLSPLLTSLRTEELKGREVFYRIKTENGFDIKSFQEKEGGDKK